MVEEEGNLVVPRAREVITNLRVLKRTNKKPEAGDIFAMQIPDGRYLFGRVIEADLPRDRAPMPLSNLVYIYDALSVSEKPALERLNPSNLLIPPYFTNRKLWTLGYAKVVDHADVLSEDRLEHHSFKDLIADHRYRIVDEFGVETQHVSDLCGTWGLVSYRYLDDRISEALGIPPASPSPGDKDDSPE